MEADMTAPVALLDETAIRKIVSEELGRQLAPILAAIKSVATPATASDDPLSRMDLASLLGIGSRTLRRMELAGLLPPPIRASQRAVWWPHAVIQKWMDSGGHIQARASLRIRKGRGSV
jgi:predicted DNA-binding transcriptional regulator AlpA